MVAVGAALISFETSSEPTTTANEPAKAPDKFAQTSPGAAAVTTEKAPVAEKNAKVMTSPSVRKHAREAGIDLIQIHGSGPRGRILRSDLDGHLSGSSPAVSKPVAEATLSTEITEIKVIGLRRKIAERMSEANHEVPSFAYVEEIDITSLESLRQHLNSRNTANDDKLTLLPFIGLALARVLKQFPQCNALYDKERNVISQHRAVHLGVATQTPDGLKVPVVKHSESLSLRDLSSEIRRVSTAARENTAKRDELMGSTVTITSLGKLGGVVTTPVITILRIDNFFNISSSSVL